MSVLIRDFWLKTVSIALGMVWFGVPVTAQIDQSAELPIPDERGNYQPSFPVHPTWEIVDRGLSGLNCYETFPPNPGSNQVVSRLFSKQILEATVRDEEGEVWVESSAKTWLSVIDPWSGQSCWVRAHEDFIKPIEDNPDLIEKSKGF
jgi:hypothetical protein